MASFGAELEHTFINKGELIRTGYMEKQGEVVRSYKKRYFKLWSNHILEYFTNQSSSKSTPKGTIDLSSTLNMTKTDDKQFEVECPSRIWHFKTKTKFSRDSWYESIFMIWKGIRHKNHFNQKQPIQNPKSKNQHKSDKSEDNNPWSSQVTPQNDANSIENKDGIYTQLQTGDIISSVPNAPQGFKFHRINNGDTLVSLSVKYGVSQNKIKQYNNDLCFGHRLTHICGKLILIPMAANVLLTENMKKQIDEIYKNDNKYNLDNLDEKEYTEPDENGKYALRKALMYHAKGLDVYRCDYYLGAAKWNVRKALKLWEKDDIWDKQQRIMKELEINVQEAMILLENFNWDVDYAIQQRKKFGNKQNNQNMFSDMQEMTQFKK